MENEAVRSKGRCSVRYRISSKLGRTRRKFDEETWRRIKEEASMSRRGVISSAISCGATAVRSLITVTTTMLFKSSSVLIILGDQSRIQGKGIQRNEAWHWRGLVIVRHQVGLPREVTLAAGRVPSLTGPAVSLRIHRLLTQLSTNSRR
jgi:hypothetical protein